MSLLLPTEHPYVTPRAPTAQLRVGIVNIMPRVEAYEPLLLGPLAELPQAIEPVFIRLESHAYQSSDHAHLDRFYRSFGASGALDALIITGAPVEELPFEDVRYFRELEHIVGIARTQVPATLGLCWGALLLARVLGVGKQLFERKLFGVFEDRVTPGAEALLGGGTYVCAHSRHSGIAEDEFARAEAAGVVRTLGRGEATGTTVFESVDGALLGHVGHPEYIGERLAYEWHRDRDLGRTDVSPPANFDADAASTTWRAHQQAVFAGLVARATR